MIFNIYTYLFFSSLASGAAMALLIRTLKSSNRNALWSVSAIPFLVYLIISVIILVSGLLIAGSEDFWRSVTLVFFVASFALFSLSFYFLKALTLPIVLLALLIVTFSFQSSLKEFSSFKDDKVFSIKTLQWGNEETKMEVKDFNGQVEFSSYPQDKMYPLFLILDFPAYLFFLESSSYIMFTGFISESEELEDALSGVYEKQQFSILPFHHIRLYDSPLVAHEGLSTLSVRLDKSGELHFLQKNK